MPPGLSLDAHTGWISGTPDAPTTNNPTYAFTVQVTDALGAAASKDLTILVHNSVPNTGGAGGLYTITGYGALNPDGSSPAVSTTASWPGWNIARGAAMRPDGTGGYVLDGWGGLHPFGNAPDMTPSGFWRGWDIARGIALTPDGGGGWCWTGGVGCIPLATPLR